MTYLLSVIVKNPALRYVLGAVIIVVVAILYGSFKYNQGYETRDLEYKVIIEEERTRVREANRLALEDAKKRIQELEITVERRNVQLQDIIRQADEDPDAGRPSLSRSSVQRLNRIR